MLRQPWYSNMTDMTILTNMKENTMSQPIDVAEAKSRFSEILNRASYGNERFVVRKHGKPVAAIVSTEDLAKLESDLPGGRRGLLGLTGLLADYPDWGETMDDVIRERHSAADREVDLE